MDFLDGGSSVAATAAIRFWYNSSTNSSDYDNIQDAAAAAVPIHPEHYMLFSDDIDQFFKKINLSNVSDNNTLYSDQNHLLNCTFFNFGNNSTLNSSLCIPYQDDTYHNYWALLLVLFPILTLFGNVLVILSVYRERTLQTATNYFIVSLALADLLVAVVVMPFAVYVLVNGTWALPSVVCDFYIAMDVTCSTSSIFNLVAISIDRYIAVTQPIKYAKHKNNRRIWMTIALVWVISAAIGSPIVLGLNNTPDRIPDACLFFNSDFILFSSLSSFYIPCIIMVFLYYNIFKALRKRALAQKASRKPLPSEIKAGSVIENLANTKRLAETHLGPTPIEEQATNTGSGSADEDDDIVDAAECQVISNDKSTEFILATVVEEAAVLRRKDSKVYDKIISSVVASLATPNNLGDPNGNNDSGYAHSQADSIAPESPRTGGGGGASGSGGRGGSNRISGKKNGAAMDTEMRTVATITSRTASIRSISGSKKDKRTSTAGTTGTAAAGTAAARFTIYKVNKASRKKREKSSAKKERKATKTLAIVLGVFLICWVPFFTCNVLDAMCSKLNFPCNPGVSAFLLTTWLGYMNSFVNPVIYTIFNPEFRKAFKKIMCLGP